MLKKTSYEQLREYIDDYIAFMERINKKRLDAANKEVEHVESECRAFNMLRKNIKELE